jgi:hypothetical protein
VQSRRNRAGRTLAAALGAAFVGAGVTAAAQVPVEKVPIVAVAGCVEARGDTWMLTRATEPEPSIANGPPAGQPYKGPTAGKQTFQLIGVSGYDVPTYQGQLVLVKALHIKAQPTSRLNITSITRLEGTCPQAPQ